jgi:hypothetical protein
MNGASAPAYKFAMFILSAEGQRTLATLPSGALVIRLQPGAQASFAMPPERKPRTEPWHGGMVRLPALVKSGIYQITLSDDAWIDVIP